MVLPIFGRLDQLMSCGSGSNTTILYRPLHGFGTGVKELHCLISKDQGMLGLRLPWGMGVVGTAAETGEPSVVNDVADSESFSPTVDRIYGEDENSRLS